MMEFDTIRKIARVFPQLDIEDDAALIPLPQKMSAEGGGFLAVSVDAQHEDVHFRRSWLMPRQLGYRAAAVSFSDLSAMGARPLFMLVSLFIPDNLGQDFVLEFNRGPFDFTEAHQVVHLGGNISSG